ncbi:lipopolysaccharide assembly protein LapA domain-containing protein [Rhodococcus sp. G-MC3]|uniref:LapA family protein n=1 Tax=Rhodococcus sp. G-MC3 TaxID=3046209 RepID=UPI0024B9BF78|nr:lipopolysaccharide assembly protein LapA domain-containing protein [Rhodococcus sp. G-MC3]MDJ0391904.1 lipopolysaccharide assembly protein LapA domain-containing protein [Rhodococcus sp. G-MC3]
MSTPAGGRHDGSPLEPSSVPATYDDSAHSPITTPDSDDHSAPDPEAVRDTRRPAGQSPAGIAHTKAAATWTGLVVGAIVLVILLVFILQNLDAVPVSIFVWTFQLPLGVSMLLAAIAGALVMALAGGVRILQIRRAAKLK